MRGKGFEVVGANGFEPSTSWSRTRRANVHNNLHFNVPSEKQELNPLIEMWLVVSGCGCPPVGSLQKSLHPARARNLLQNEVPS
jgi:hypothetical protein